MSARRVALRDRISSLLAPLAPEFGGTLSLHLFGSTSNGFGRPSSDVDMCLIREAPGEAPQGGAVGFEFLFGAGVAPAAAGPREGARGGDALRDGAQARRRGTRALSWRARVNC